MAGVDEPPTDRFGFYRPQKEDLYRGVPVPDEKLVRKRETKWREMLEKWNAWMKSRFKKVKMRCRKGIPQSLRGMAWQYLSGSRFLQSENSEKYQQFVSTNDDECPWLEYIDRDLHRTFPEHYLFKKLKGQGQSELRDVLKAYSLYDPIIGYCQPMAPIVATLLLHMPAEQAFWCMVKICQKYLPDYFTPGLKGIKTDSDLFEQLLKTYYPAIAIHLVESAVSRNSIHITENWLIRIKMVPIHFSICVNGSCVYTQDLFLGTLS
eukprot:m.130245 g.130245  ORF g.130245 m.130245 type:complete len:264 (+) comp38014_c0_seq5:25-816(+)